MPRTRIVQKYPEIYLWEGVFGNDIIYVIDENGQVSYLNLNIDEDYRFTKSILTRSDILDSESITFIGEVK